MLSTGQAESRPLFQRKPTSRNITKPYYTKQPEYNSAVKKRDIWAEEFQNCFMYANCRTHFANVLKTKERTFTGIFRRPIQTIIPQLTLFERKPKTIDPELFEPAVTLLSLFLNSWDIVTNSSPHAGKTTRRPPEGGAFL